MTNPEAANAIYGIIQMMLTIGLPLCMVAGWRDAPKKKNTTTRRAKRGRRPASVKASDLVNVRRRRAKAEKARPLSDWEQMEIDRYFLKRNFVTL
jgi:hypothetical protein